MKHRIPKPYVAVVLAVFASCQGFETVPETGRRRSALQYTEKQMADLGANAYRETIAEYTVIEGTPEARLVQSVAERVAAATGKDFDWEFKLLDAPDTINAFCLPGGKIAVFSGILPIAQGEGGLAVVISHEVAPGKSWRPATSSTSSRTGSCTLPRAPTMPASGSNSSTTSTACGPATHGTRELWPAQAARCS